MRIPASIGMGERAGGKPSNLKRLTHGRNHGSVLPVPVLAGRLAAGLQQELRLFLLLARQPVAEGALVAALEAELLALAFAGLDQMLEAPRSHFDG
jgi:hypothetical protein